MAEGSKTAEKNQTQFVYIEGSNSEKDNTEQFEKLQKHENVWLNERRKNVECKFKDSEYSALALSGGGIRSASFALGVLQYLARYDHLKKFDYLSTVSGGGYIGTSLSWLLHQPISKKKKAFNTGPDGFPYGAYRRGKEEEHENTSSQTALLDRLRQRGNYLTPGAGINIFSLISVVLRGTFLSMVVFFPLITFVVFLLTINVKKLGLIEVQNTNVALVLAFAIFIFAAFASLFYALYSYNGQNLPKKLLEIHKRFKKSKAKIAERYEVIRTLDSLVEDRYKFRRKFEKLIGQLLVIFLISLCFASLLPIHDYLKNLTEDGIANRSVGIFMSVGGALGSFIGYAKTRTAAGGPSNSILRRMLPWLTAGTLIFGLLLLSYSFIESFIYAEGESLLQHISATAMLIGVVALVGIVAHYVNLNYITIHRFYRDRLMEAFLPNVNDIVSGQDTTQGATKANSFMLSGLGDDLKNPIAPLHLINTNLVLIDSKHRKSRSRGGDSFVLSPLFSGSQATGWCNSKMLSGGDITLATAMAISGAAANPNTGASGEGSTRNPAFALLMSLLNIRLGYWIVNPWYSSTKNPRKPYKASPNFLDPLLSSLLSGVLFWSRNNRKTDKASYAQDEYNKFIELTDGGHFENLGIYELVRRKVKKILIIDAAADPKYKFSDLANAIEKIRVDFGVILDINIDHLTPSSQCNPHEICYSVSAVAYGTLKYPDDEHNPGEVIYLKTCFTSDLQPDLISYKIKNPDFPDQSTGDQFFDEKQFEAYRELGYCLARQLRNPLNKPSDTTGKKNPAETALSVLFGDQAEKH